MAVGCLRCDRGVRLIFEGLATGEVISVELPRSQEQVAGWCDAFRESTVKALSLLRTRLHYDRLAPGRDRSPIRRSDDTRTEASRDAQPDPVRPPAGKVLPDMGAGGRIFAP